VLDVYSTNSVDYIGLGNEDITLTDLSVDAVDLTLIDSKTSGTISVDASSISGSYSNLNAIYNINFAHFSNLGDEDIQIDDLSISALNLESINDQTTGFITVDATSIDGDYVDVMEVYDANSADYVGLGDEDITLTDAFVSVGNVNAVAALTDGVVTATLSSGSLLDFANLDEVGNAYTITIDNTSTDTLQALDLSTLGGKTTATVTVLNAVTISGTADELMAALDSEQTKVIVTDANIIFTSAPTVAQYEAIDSATNGNITYSSIADTISNLVDDAEQNTSAVAFNKPITVLDTSVNAVDLIYVSENTDQTVTATAALTITGSALELLEIVNDAGISTRANYNAVITETVSASQISTIDFDTSGTISVADVVDTIGNISTYNGLSAANAAILQNAATITATGDGNNDSANFASVLHGMIINSLGGNDSLTGTGFDDLITGGLGADSMFGGNGADTFIFATGDAPTALVGSLTYDKIGDFSATADKIDLSVTPTLGAAESKTATLGGLAGTVSIDAQGKIDFTVDESANDVAMTEILLAVRSVVNGSSELGFFEWNDGFNGNGTFIYQENGISANDSFIFLAGVTSITDISSIGGDANTLWVI
jgi:hypothetical protein